MSILITKCNQTVVWFILLIIKPPQSSLFNSGQNWVVAIFDTSTMLGQYWVEYTSVEKRVSEVYRFALISYLLDRDFGSGCVSNKLDNMTVIFNIEQSIHRVLDKSFARIGERLNK